MAFILLACQEVVKLSEKEPWMFVVMQSQTQKLLFFSLVYAPKNKSAEYII